MRTTTVTTTALALFAIACSPNAANTGDDVDAAVEDAGVDAEEVVVDMGTCGSQAANIGVTNLGDPPDILVILDRSGSMLKGLGGGNTVPSRWDVMKSALSTTVTNFDDSIKFGLIPYPSDNYCAVTATPTVGIGLSTAAGFSSYYTSAPALDENANTPTHTALAGALAHYNTIPVNPAGRYVLLATDGLPNCLNGQGGTNSRMETVQAVTNLANAGIKTFVLGFDIANDATATTLLNQAAEAGLVPRAGATKYYAANNAAQLQSSLDAIAGGIVQPSCSFELASIPPDPDNVTVTINGSPVPRSPSHNNGWDYHPNAQTITFFGSYCTLIENGAQSAVNFTYGCPGPVIN